MDYDDAYANVPYIPGGAEYPAKWAEQAAEFRAGAKARLDVPYGDHPRQRFDLFLPEGEAKGLFVFVHGGYWLKFDKSYWSHLAVGALSHGFAVAMPSYRLAPEVSIAQITTDIRAALIAAAASVDGPILLAGHSAGGHLVSRMICADAAPPGTVSSRLAHVMPISAVADLRPLLHTSMNDQFKMDEAAAIAESPTLQQPATDIPVTVWVGGAERPVFLDQSRWLTEAWSQANMTVTEGEHHFNVIEGLSDQDSPITNALFAPLT